MKIFKQLWLYRVACWLIVTGLHPLLRGGLGYCLVESTVVEAFIQCGLFGTESRV